MSTVTSSKVEFEMEDLKKIHLAIVWFVTILLDPEDQYQEWEAECQKRFAFLKGYTLPSGHQDEERFSQAGWTFWRDNLQDQVDHPGHLHSLDAYVSLPEKVAKLGLAWLEEHYQALNQKLAEMLKVEPLVKQDLLLLERERQAVWETIRQFLFVLEETERVEQEYESPYFYPETWMGDLHGILPELRRQLYAHHEDAKSLASSKRAGAEKTAMQSFTRLIWEQERAWKNFQKLYFLVPEYEIVTKTLSLLEVFIEEASIDVAEGKPTTKAALKEDLERLKKLQTVLTSVNEVISKTD